MTQFIPLKPGINGFDHDHTRGAFKYATFFVPAPSDPIEGQAYPFFHRNPKNRPSPGQQPLNMGAKKESIGIKEVWVEFTAAPGQKNPRNYTGYFYSSDKLLNRIW